MNRLAALTKKLEALYGKLALLILTPVVIVDWHVLEAGGFSLLGGMVPVVAVIFLFYLFCLLCSAIKAIGFVQKRQVVRLIGLLVLIGCSFAYARWNASQIHERQLATAKDALTSLLLMPKAQRVWYHTAKDEQEFSILRQDPKNKAEYVSARRFDHVYYFILGGSGVTRMKIEVILLQDGRRFNVYRDIK